MADTNLVPAGFGTPPEQSFAYVQILKNTPKCAKIPTKYKAIRADNGEWVDGPYVESMVVNDDGLPDGYILDRTGFSTSTPTVGLYVKVRPSTVCIGMGEYDGDGIEIFTGDIISCNKGAFKFVVRYGICGGVANNANYGYKGFYFEPYGKTPEEVPNYTLRNDPLYWMNSGYAYVIGNIYDVCK